jgi:Pentapeptide repeats (9 copies)
MTRDETIGLFERCENARETAFQRELQETRDETVALDISHQGAKAAWNEWAEARLAEQDLLKKRGLWRLLIRQPFETRIEWRHRLSPDMQDWLARARVNFSACRLVSNSPNIRSLSQNNRIHDINPEIPQPTKTVYARTTWIDFRQYIFPGEADFTDTEFVGATAFEEAVFEGMAWFRSIESNHIRFNKAIFKGNCWFRGANFNDDASFTDVTFKADADFSSIYVYRGFYLERCVFSVVPDFTQAHFYEAPRLDVIEIKKQSSPSESPRIASFAGGRWRALKRLAIQGHDTDRELEFHAREVRSQRFAGDWPLPIPTWRREAWAGFWRFWSGTYETYSDFGRSLFRPLAFWALAVGLGAIVYVSQSPELVVQRAQEHAAGSSPLASILRTAFDAWWSQKIPCYVGQPAPPKDKNGDTPVYVGRSRQACKAARTSPTKPGISPSATPSSCSTARPRPRTAPMAASMAWSSMAARTRSRPCPAPFRPRARSRSCSRG